MSEDVLLSNFRPQSCLVTKQTRVDKPRFPAIDAHNHLTLFGDNWLKRPVRELLDRFRVPHATHTEVGHKAEAIAEAARRFHCDHIVMGTARQNSLTRMFESSVTNRVLDLTTVPVEIIVGDSISKLERFGVPAGIGAGLAALLLLTAD